MLRLTFAIFWIAASAGAASLETYLNCAGELIVQSRGHLLYSRRVPGTFVLSTHNEIFVYRLGHGDPARTFAYTLPEKGLLTDDGDRAYFLRIPSHDINRPLLLSLVQSNGQNWLLEYATYNPLDEYKFQQPTTVAAEKEAQERLRAELLARLADMPRFHADWNRRFPREPRTAALMACEQMDEPDFRQILAATRDQLDKVSRGLSSTPH